MTIKSFRERHSYLIEQYQWIEWELETIYASIGHRNFHEGLHDVEKTNLNKLLTYIVETEKDTGREILTESEKAELRNLLPRRNYWVHNCYTEIRFDSKTEDISNQSDVDALENDIRIAEALKNRLFDIKRKVIKP